MKKQELPEMILINNEPSKPLGWFNAHGYQALILTKMNKDENYFHILPHSFALFKIEYLFSTNPSINKYRFEDQDPDFYSRCLFELNEKYIFKLDYDLVDKWVGNVMNKENEIVYDVEIEGLRGLSDGKYVLFDVEKYKNNHFERIEKLYKTDEELKSILSYSSDFEIVRHLNHPLSCDIQGTLRFVEEELTEKESLLYSDLNEAWRSYYDEKVSFSELIKLYMKIGYSVNGFMEVYYSCFLKPEFSEDDENYDEDKTLLCSAEEIIKILSNELEPYDKNR